jgi:hypothetical protein
VVLKNPKLEGDKLTFNGQTLEVDLNRGDGSAVIFIDIIGDHAAVVCRRALPDGDVRSCVHIVTITRR